MRPGERCRVGISHEVAPYVLPPPEPQRTQRAPWPGRAARPTLTLGLCLRPPHRSLELLFASGQNNKLLYGDPPKSPRATRKFSSPPPLSITKTSSPSRRRKLSLNIPIITGGKALDLAALSCSSNGYTSLYSAVSPFSKATLDTSKLFVSSSFANKIPDEGETATEKPEEPVALSKQSEWTCGPSHPLGPRPHQAAPGQEGLGVPADGGGGQSLGRRWPHTCKPSLQGPQGI